LPESHQGSKEARMESSRESSKEAYQAIMQEKQSIMEADNQTS
jgi:hypothetical protein